MTLNVTKPTYDTFDLLDRQSVLLSELSDLLGSAVIAIEEGFTALFFEIYGIIAERLAQLKQSTTDLFASTKGGAA